MAEAFAVNIATDTTKSLISRIWQEIQCLWDYKNNLKKLENKYKELEAKTDAVKLSVDAAENNAEVIGPDVKHWLQEVNNIDKEVNELLKNTSNTQWGCLCCKCPELHSRYKLSKQVLKCTTEVIGLQDSCKFERIGHPAQPGQMPFTSPGEFTSFESRMKILNDVMEALSDDSITTIGICGMAGVGKTTLVKEIADKVKAAKLFDEVVMAVVSNDAVVAKVQDQLAESLGMKIGEKTDRGRAERLYKRLMNDDKRILVILDDIWKKLDLHDIGIPIKGERGGLKVLLSSRFIEVCSNMKAKPFEVDLLFEEESWHLFKVIAEITEEENEIIDVVKQVANECGRLPLAIVTVGGALKNKKDYVWREVLQQLKEASVTSIPDMQKLVNSRIELSYNYLEKDSKLLLLLCSLFPEDYNIPLDNLVRYVMGLQLFKNLDTMARARDRVCTVMDDLKSCYLLLEGNEENCAKLHDVIRDVCLSITSSGKNMHMVKHDGLKEWPKGSYASSTAISLTFGAIDQLISSSEYPKLELLRLNFQKKKCHIREDFFERMKEIKVLELCSLDITLPSSLQLLVKLQTLCLTRCKLYGNFSVLGSQKELKILSFYRSSLEHFPDKISELTNLKSLDLRLQKGPPLPSGILVQLKKLEELYLHCHIQKWEHEGEEADRVIIKEISSLLNLHTIQFCAYDNHSLEQVIERLHCPEKLMRFDITSLGFINDRTTSVHPFRFPKYQCGKVLTLQRINVDLFKNHATQYLLLKTEDLTLKVAKGLTNLVSELDVKGFVNLKKLTLLECYDLRYLVDATSFRTSGGGAFINLEELIIEDAQNLEELCHGNLPLGSFARLRKIELYNLPALRSCGLKRSLLQLQVIDIVNCPKLEIIVSNNEGEKDRRDVEFPKLEFLRLDSLKNFKGFVPESSSGALFEKVAFPNLDTLHIFEVNGIRCVVDGDIPFGSLSNLRSMSIRL